MWFSNVPRVPPIFIVLSVLQSTASTSLVGKYPIDRSGAAKACQLLQDSFPQLVSFPGKSFQCAEQYINDTAHAAVTSSQNATCSIEPMNKDEVSAIIRLVGRSDIRAPFAVKSGGHAYNLGQSSTAGVQISLARFKNITYNAEQSTVTVGMGLTWDQVYEQLEPLGVMVAGGRINGVGVGGFGLGGGYSWKSNQFGLLIDTVVSHELVLPTGEQVHVSNTSNADLFFALKGGLNNFGIVTEMTLEAHPQTLVYGGLITYTLDNIDLVNSATSDFSFNNTDPKAQLITSYVSAGNQFKAGVSLFYDAPTPPAGLFDAFLSIPSSASNVKSQTFVDFMATLGFGDMGIGPFGTAQHTTPILQYPKTILDEMVTQVNSFGARLSAQNNGSTIIVSCSPEPFLSVFAHSLGGAYPHPPSRQVTPTSLSISYPVNPNTPLAIRTARSDVFVEEVRKFGHIIQSRAVEEGLSRWDDILYPNYALSDTPLELLYGENLPRLRQLATKYDPDKVMTLTGGFRFQN